MKTLFMIGNTHFDPVWLWTWDEAMASIRATFRSALDRMKEDPDFTYSFCTPPVFEWIKQTDPEMFEEIKLRASQGRWDVSSEGWWLQPDCNNLSGESLIRQGVYGQRYVMENFGKYATSVLNIDSFGHSAAIPQIMSKCGLKYYVFARPDKNDLYLNDNLFKWRSKDGSEVLVYRCGSHKDGEIYPNDMKRYIDKQRQNLLKSNHDLMLVYGVSDHGGGPTKQAINDIHNAQNHFTDISIGFSSVERFFSAQQEDTLPCYAGELQPAFYGSFSNCADVKRKNRKAEYRLFHAETASWISCILAGREYPGNEIYSCWKDIMFNQFHDILGGTSISDAFDDAANLYGRALQVSSEIINFSLQSVCRLIKTVGNNCTSVWNLCIFNLTGTDFSGFTEAEVQWAWEFPWYSGPIELEDEKGYIHSAQIIQTKSSIPGFRSRFVFKADIPAMGYRTYAVKQVLNKKEFAKTNSEIISPFCFRVYEDQGDVWCFNSSDGYGPSCEKPVLESSQMVEIGEIRNTLKQVWTFRRSIFEEYITVYHENGEIEYRYNINWNEKHKVLKLLPTFGNKVDELIVSVPCGTVSRSSDGREYPSGEWMVLHDATLLFDGIFAYDTDDGILRLTVVRSPIFGDLRTEPLNENCDYKYMEQGVHSGRIRYIPKKLGNNEAASRFAQWIIPPETVCEANHNGILPAVWQGLSVNGTNAVVTALKHAEEKDGFILRLTELDGQKSKFSVKLGDIFSDCIEIQPHEIKTLCFNSSGEVFETDLLENERGEQ